MLTLKACVTQLSADAFNFARFDQNFSVCYLPIMFAGGKPTSLEKITEEELETFVPFMILCSFNHPDNSNGAVLTVNRAVQHVFSGPKPPWWFRDLPFQYPLEISGMWRNKFAVLKSLVCRCYTYYNCEYILRLCAELAEEKPENLYYRKQRDDESMLSLFNDGKFIVKFWKENMLYDSPDRPVKVFLDSSDSGTKTDAESSGSDVKSAYPRKRKRLEKHSSAKSSKSKKRKYSEKSGINQLHEQSNLVLHQKTSKDFTNCGSKMQLETKVVKEGQSFRGCCSEKQPEFITQESVLSTFGLVKSHKNTSKKSVKKLNVEKNSREHLSRRAQLQVFQNVPVSSDLGRKYLGRMKPYVHTDYHVEKIEKYVNNCSSVFRRSDIIVASYLSALSGDDSDVYTDVNQQNGSRDNSSNKSNCNNRSGVHSPLTSTCCSSRFYKFPTCRRCKSYLHCEMRKCTCPSGSAESNIAYCYVQLHALSEEKIESLKKCCVDKTFMTNESEPNSISLNNDVEVIDLTFSQSDDDDDDSNDIKYDKEDVKVAEFITDKSERTNAGKPEIIYKNIFGSNLQSYMGEGSSGHGFYSREDRGTSYDGDVITLDSVEQGYSKTATDGFNSLPLFKQNNDGMGLGNFEFKSFNQSSKRNFRETSSHHVIRLSNDKSLPKEVRTNYIDVDRSMLNLTGTKLSKKDVLEGNILSDGISSMFNKVGFRDQSMDNLSSSDRFEMINKDFCATSKNDYTAVTSSKSFQCLGDGKNCEDYSLLPKLKSFLLMDENINIHDIYSTLPYQNKLLHFPVVNLGHKLYDEVLKAEGKINIVNQQKMKTTRKNLTDSECKNKVGVRRILQEQTCNTRFQYKTFKQLKLPYK